MNFISISISIFSLYTMFYCIPFPILYCVFVTVFLHGQEPYIIESLLVGDLKMI